jgi:hypothetical protein
MITYDLENAYQDYKDKKYYDFGFSTGNAIELILFGKNT